MSPARRFFDKLYSGEQAAIILGTRHRNVWAKGYDK